MSPAAEKPIAAYPGAGPGEPDSALTVNTIKEESLQSTLHEVTVSASRTEGGRWFHQRGA